MTVIRWLGRACFIWLALAATSASAMTVAEFLTRADALKAKGMMAMFSGSEIKALKGEVMTAAGAYRDDVAKARLSGTMSFGCPPAKGKAKLSSDDLIAGLRAIPADRRQSISVKAGFYDFMKARYPCK